MYAFIQSAEKKSFYRAIIVENEYGVYQWKYVHNDHDVGDPFSNLEDAVSILREARLKWDNPKALMVVIDGRSISVAITDIDYREKETIVEEE